MTIDLIIFDCDGVLVDSEIISCRACAATLTRHGYPITAEQVHDRFLGRSSRDMCAEVEAELGRAMSADFDADLLDELLRAFAVDLKAMPHLAAALDAIRQPVCVASSGPPAKIEASLSRVGLYDRFAPNIFSARQVRRGKPAPDLFVFAAEAMGAPPARCLVIEDSVSGVIGATAAGMTVAGFSGGSHCRPGHAATLRAAGAAASLDDMAQLPGLIGQFDAARRHP